MTPEAIGDVGDAGSAAFDGAPSWLTHFRKRLVDPTF